MAYRVVWTAPALADLEQAAGYIAETSSVYAAAFARDVRGASRSLRQFAGRGRIVPEIGDPTVRELFVQRYRLIYRTRDEVVEIAALIHGSRDLAPVIGPFAGRD